MTDTDRLSWWEKLPLALATTAQSVVVGFWYYRYIDLGMWRLNIIIAVIAGLALDAIVVTTIMGRRVGRDSTWSMGASFGAFACSALIAVDSYSTWLAPIRPILHVSYPAMVFLYSQHLATARGKQGVAVSVSLPQPTAMQAAGFPVLPARARVEGHVYILRAEHGPYKIGCSTELQKRISGIKASLPFAIETIHTIKTNDTERLEQGLHAVYSSAQRRINGEWFHLFDDDIVFLVGLGTELDDEAIDLAIDGAAAVVAASTLPSDLAVTLEAKKRIAAQLRAERKSWREIANAVGRSPSTVREWLAAPASNEDDG